MELSPDGDERSDDVSALRSTLLSQVAEQVAEGVAVFDLDDRLIYANPAIRELYGSTGPELLGQPISFFIAPDDLERHAVRSDHHELITRSEITIRRHDGSPIETEVTISWLVNSGGGPIGRIVCVRDLTERKELERQLMRAASHDALTDLPNRRLLADRLEHALAGARRNGTTLAVLFIDLDGFKMINDQYGHDAGDMLLQMVGERLRPCIRDSDTLARMGGDEFVIILENITTVSGPQRTAERISESLAPAFDLDGTQVLISASIGIALSSSANQDGLLRSADAAMYEAKASGPGHIVGGSPPQPSGLRVHA